MEVPGAEGTEEVPDELSSHAAYGLTFHLPVL